MHYDAIGTKGWQAGAIPVYNREEVTFNFHDGQNSQSSSMIFTPEATLTDGSVSNPDLAGKEEDEGGLSSGLTLNCFPEDCEDEESGRGERCVKELKAIINVTDEEIRKRLEPYRADWKREGVEGGKEKERKDMELSRKIDRMEKDIEILKRDIECITMEMTEFRSSIRWMDVNVEMMTFFGFLGWVMAYIC
jgi:hypothetical protein